MATLTIRFSDDEHARLRELARYRNISVNTLMEELSTIALVEFDSETRFRAVASRASRKSGLELLAKPDDLES